MEIWVFLGFNGWSLKGFSDISLQFFPQVGVFSLKEIPNPDPMYTTLSHFIIPIENLIKG